MFINNLEITRPAQEKEKNLQIYQTNNKSEGIPVRKFGYWYFGEF